MSELHDLMESDQLFHAESADQTIDNLLEQIATFCAAPYKELSFRVSFFTESGHEEIVAQVLKLAKNFGTVEYQKNVIPDFVQMHDKPFFYAFRLVKNIAS